MRAIFSASPATDVTDMVGNLLLRGMLAGLIAAALAFVFSWVWGEPEIDAAIAIEEMLAEPDGAHEHELVSRATQSTTGLATGLLIYGAAIGGLFALVFALVWGRVARLGARGTAALLALGAYLAVVVVPQLKYPANPPAVGQEDTIGARTWLFFIVLAASIAALVIGVAVARRLWEKSGPWRAAAIGALAWLVLVTLMMLILPTIQEVPESFPGDVLWRFRLSTFGVHAILWAVIGLVFGALAERAMPRLAPRG